ncbi:hypothetical protein SUDANB105_07910 [Streptomyces sp. enrichment culture]|uniref:hypothetical protein n=1 Tax=Streptomyces sp. enrichment culture TaxID=1795815 RepID=UPI003F5513FE
MRAFESIRWQPSSRLLDHVGHDLEGNRAFALVGDQQDAFVWIRRAAARHLPAGDEEHTPGGGGAGAVITVRGGPGSGKTTLAVRLLGYLMRRHRRARPHVSGGGRDADELGDRSIRVLLSYGDAVGVEGRHLLQRPGELLPPGVRLLEDRVTDKTGWSTRTDSSTW